jgi:16S rRNA (guanine(966)-N(2))-methyltransferase RsmD
MPVILEDGENLQCHTPIATAVDLDMRKLPPQEVRLIGGRYKRTPLPAPLVPGLRPTSSRVRETLFNWLGQDLTGWRVLDAFAGSGALGLEATSRGATEVTLLEQHPKLAQQILQTVTRLGALGVQVHRADAVGWMRHCAQKHPLGCFDLVFLDPPFEQDLFDQALQQATQCVVNQGWIYLEAPQPWGHLLKEGEAARQLPTGLSVHKHARAGTVYFHLIQVERISA